MTRRIVVVIAGANPTFDYYLAPRLALDHASRIDVVDWARDPRELDLLADPANTSLVFCRYVAPPWIAFLRGHSRAFAAVGLLVDDDYLSVLRDGTVAARYRRKLWRQGVWPALRLRRRWTHLWVGSPALARRVGWIGGRRLAPVILPPVASPVDLRPGPATPGAGLRIGFHATAVHRREHAWLAAFTPRLLDACPPGATLEVVADAQLAPLWAGRDNVVIRPPLDWPAYRAMTAEGPGLDLLLAPLLEAPINGARSSTKVIDAVRMGAAPVLADGPAYAPFAGCAPTLPPAPERWIAEIASLSRDPARRRTLWAAAKQRLEDDARRAAPFL